MHIQAEDDGSIFTDGFWVKKLKCEHRLIETEGKAYPAAWSIDDKPIRNHMQYQSTSIKTIQKCCNDFIYLPKTELQQKTNQNNVVLRKRND